MSELLEQVTAAAKAKRDLERTLEARLREEMKRQLAEADTALAVAAGQAFRAGTAKAAIGRALGSKDYNTYNDYITRGFDLTAGVESDTTTPNGLVIGFTDERVVGVEYNGQYAEVEWLYDGESTEPVVWTQYSMWNDDYSVRNEIVYDVTNENGIYEDIVKWIERNAE
jgi:hypothetical protein